MIQRSRNESEKRRRRELQSQLDNARKEKQDVERAGRAAKPLLQQLQKHLKENNFAERVVQAIDANRRRTT